MLPESGKISRIPVGLIKIVCASLPATILVIKSEHAILNPQTAVTNYTVANFAIQQFFMIITKIINPRILCCFSPLIANPHIYGFATITLSVQILLAGARQWLNLSRPSHYHILYRLGQKRIFLTINVPVL